MFLRSGDGGFPLWSRGDFADWSPAVDITEDDDEYTITADLPEVEKDHVSVTLDDGFLTLRGERERKEEAKKKKVHRVERSYGRYVRSFRLPLEVESGNIRAEFGNGVLTVHLPKSAEAGSHEREIAIQ